jgi:nucleoside-diphosphate-sugar epimerase
MRILVTGSTGGLGPYVVSELERAGHELVLFSRRQPPASRWPWAQGDITVFEDCLRAADMGFDAIQHLAALGAAIDAAVALGVHKNFPEAVERMVKKDIRRLLVMDSDRLLGIITERDVFRWVIRVAYEPNLPDDLKKLIESRAHAQAPAH